MLGQTTIENSSVSLVYKEIPTFDWNNLDIKRHRLDNKEFITCGDYSLIGYFSMWVDKDGKMWHIKPNEELEKYIDYLIISKRFNWNG